MEDQPQYLTLASHTTHTHCPTVAPATACAWTKLVLLLRLLPPAAAPPMWRRFPLERSSNSMTPPPPGPDRLAPKWPNNSADGTRVKRGLPSRFLCLVTEQLTTEQGRRE